MIELVSPTLAAGLRAPAPEIFLPPSNGRLLVVEDETAMRNGLVDLLEQEGYACEQAADGESALARVSDDVSLVLTDLRMPCMDGMTLLKRIVAERPGVAVVVLSSYSDVPSAVEAMRHGAYDYVARPFMPEDLTLRIQRALERRQLLLRDQEHQRKLQALVDQQREELALAIGELQATYQTTLEALASALDLRDKETEGHSRRVTEYTTVIARALGVEGETLNMIRQGALLHDVGKIGIPDAVLHKPGPLSAEDWSLMRLHPEIGRDLLKDIEFLDEAVSTIVLQHQERFDGSGYPGGYAEAEIPMGARIFAVADTLDAITVDRVYRRARPLEVAKAEIRRHAGRQFDPLVVEAFLAVPDPTWYAIQNAVAILHSRVH